MTTLIPTSGGLSTKARDLSVLFLCAFILCVAPSTQSLWIDEGHTAGFAQQPGFDSVLDALTQDVNSQAQMPGFIVVAWSAEKVLGSSELALRIPNLLWAWIALAFIWSAGRLLKSPWLPILLAICPFLWYYMDEARPYVMQIAGGAAAAYAISRLLVTQAVDWKLAGAWALGGVLMGTASMLGGFCFGAATLVAGFLAIRGKYFITRGPLAVLVACYGAMSVLALYYLWTILRGAGGAKLWMVSIGNIGFAFYELLGFSGLGPGRLALREAAKAGLGEAGRALIPFCPWFLALAAVMTGIFFLVLRCKPGTARQVVLANFAILVVGISGLIVAAYLAKWPFWGRHFAPFLPFLVVAIGVGIHYSSSPAVIKNATLGTLIAIWSISSFNIRFLDRHMKDDYRRAAEIAAESLQRGESVWWAADQATANYYKLPISENPENEKALFLYMPEDVQLSAVPKPNIILLSRPDQFDAPGAIRGYLKSNDFRQTASFVGFTVWEKPEAVAK